MAEELSKVLDYMETIGELDARRRRADLARRRRRERAARRRAAAVAAAGRRAGERARRGRRRLPRAESGTGAIVSTAHGHPRADRRAGDRAGPHRRAASRRSFGPCTASARWPTTSTRSRGSPARTRRRCRTARRSAASRSASRTSSPPRASRARPARASSRTTGRPTPRPRSSSSTRPGAPTLGKTNQDEFAMGSSTEHSAYGPTLNPWDRSRVPGGSSGGSAAAVAAGLVPWSIGTDTGGSIRQPAALCGIVGLKPTYGAVSRYGMIAFASSLDQAGPFTRDVTDAALLLGAMAGKDPCDSTSLGLQEPVEVPSATNLMGIRLGVPEELSGEGIEPGVLETFRATLGPRARARRHGRDDAPAARPARARRLLPDRAGRGVLEPRPLRRRALRLPRRQRARPAAHVHRDARAGLRRGGQAPDHARHLRAVLGLLRRLLRDRAEGAHEDRRGLPGRLGAVRLRRDADLADASRSSSAPSSPTRWRCTSTTSAPSR